VAYVLTTLKSVAYDEIIVETQARMKWEQDDYICDAMVDSLFDIY
jgi:hypothetical protein